MKRPEATEPMLSGALWQCMKSGNAISLHKNGWQHEASAIETYVIGININSLNLLVHARKFFVFVEQLDVQTRPNIWEHL